MRRRNNRIVIHVSDDELETINFNAEVLKLPREKYIRETLNKTDFIVPPPIDYRYFINEFNRIGNNLNQLVKQVHATNNIHEDDLLKVIQDFKTKVSELNKIILYGSNENINS